MKFFKRYKKRYIFLLLLLLILGCNGLELADMRVSESRLKSFFEKNNIRHYGTGRVKAKGREIFYAFATQIETADTTPVLIFVHGTPGSLSNSMAYLRDSFLLSHGTVVVYDRPGFGNSGLGRAMPRLKDQAAALAAVMNRFPRRPVFLVGHSYGAPVILQAAVDYPERIKGLLWVGGVIRTIWRDRAWWRFPARYPPVKWLLPKSMVASNEEILPLASELDSLGMRLDEVAVPVAMLQGGKDWLASPRDWVYADTMLINVPVKIKKRYPELSHFFYFSKPGLVVKEIKKLMAKGMKHGDPM